MKIKRPLVNPKPDDYIETPAEQQSNKSIDTENLSQLNLNVDTRKDTIHQWFNSTKMRIKKQNELYEMSFLWKNPALSLALTTLILDMIIMIGGGIIKFNSIPPKIPFFYNSIDKHWDSIDKSVVFVFPLFVFITEAMVLNFNSQIFRHDKRLSLTIYWILTLLNILLLIIVGQIYTLAVRIQ